MLDTAFPFTRLTRRDRRSSARTSIRGDLAGANPWGSMTTVHAEAAPEDRHICRDALLDRAEVPAQISATVPAFGGSYRSDDLCATAAREPRSYHQGNRAGQPAASVAADPSGEQIDVELVAEESLATRRASCR